MGKLYRGLILCLILIGSLILASCSAPLSSTPVVMPETQGTLIPAPTVMNTVINTVEPQLPVETRAVVEPAETSSPASFPDPAAYGWKPFISGLERPIDLQPAMDGSGRLFVVEQRGVIWVVNPITKATSTFLDIRQKVGSNGNEQGLLGLAFSPLYIQDGRFYLNYTDQNGTTKIARYKVSSIPDEANPDSEEVLLSVDQPYANHNGGGLAFGPDGYLYIGLGDGGSAGDPQGNGQSVDTLLGKILRIDVRSDKGYTIPPDNPFSVGGGLPEIWALGLRNPWRFSFDRGTGDLFIADVGQNRLEELNYLAANSPGGSNFGWRYREGMDVYEGQVPDYLTLIDPVWQYSHNEGCSITGGNVYRGIQMPEWNGVYLYGDYCNGRVWGLLKNAGGQWENRLLFSLKGNLSSFGLDSQGEIYVLIHNSGEVLRLEKND